MTQLRNQNGAVIMMNAGASASGAPARAAWKWRCATRIKCPEVAINIFTSAWPHAPTQHDTPRLTNADSFPHRPIASYSVPQPSPSRGFGCRIRTEQVSDPNPNLRRRIRSESGPGPAEPIRIRTWPGGSDPNPNPECRNRSDPNPNSGKLSQVISDRIPD